MASPTGRRPQSTPAFAATQLRGLSTPLERPASAQVPPKDAPPIRNTVDNGLLLQRAEQSVVKTRVGSVLSRGFILKTDHYPSGRALDLDLHVHGAPNFRAPRCREFNVFGVAQPRTQGLRAILSILRCNPDAANPSHTVWFSTREEPIVYISGRPFVLRDASDPRGSLALSDRAENLEAIEQRLRDDIMTEAKKYGGLILTHNEIGIYPALLRLCLQIPDDHIAEEESAIIPTWTAVDSSNVRTSRQLWEQMKESGWQVDYHRIPIAPDRPIEDNYLDAYTRVIKTVDPTRAALIFNCGMGAVRTTFAMVAAALTRRRQMMLMGLPDPFPIQRDPSASQSGRYAAHALQQADAQQEHSRSILRLTYILQQSLAKSDSQSAIEILLTQSTLTDNLRRAHTGNYGVILSLLGVLDNGPQAKRLVDRLIDTCDHVTNLREDILTHRLRYSLSSLDDKKRDLHLSRASRALEKYFFMITFASYVEHTTDFSVSFAEWMKARVEIWNQVTFLRKERGTRLNVFAPVSDLTMLSAQTFEKRLRTVSAGPSNAIAVQGGQVVGDEYTSHIVRNRTGIILREGTLLKSDRWAKELKPEHSDVRGAMNFRNIEGTRIYALGQPTADAIAEVTTRIVRDNDATQRIVWLTLREEPIIYLNGSPYCLRREGFTLRNMKDYGGISASRLEALEERLKEDVIQELKSFDGRILLHTELADGSVVPVWEQVELANVAVLRDIMFAQKHAKQGIELSYHRLPITAEKSPDFSDLNDLLHFIIRNHTSETPIVLNCQLGSGRSTLTSILTLLIQNWLESGHPKRPRTGSVSTVASVVPDLMASSMSTTADFYLEHAQHTPSRHSYQIINNLIRVFRNGMSIKEAVDHAIDQCAAVTNLRDSIEDARSKAEEASDDNVKRQWAAKGLQNLRRYFELIIFQAYLQSTEPTDIRSLESFETFVSNRPVLKTFEKELRADGVLALRPLERVEITDGVAQPDEVSHVVANRSGTILSASTILKSDFFSNLQKMSLPERIDGSPNFRRVALTGGDERDQNVCGSGMPTVEGLRRALRRLNAAPDGGNSVFWTSLREEPVLYIKGRPHVLRLIDRPYANVEATGISTRVVENMEKSMKKDVLREVREGNGRILLHDEVEQRPGNFELVPQWEAVADERDIMTPRDVFELMIREGYNVEYDRVAITDEQAPLPDALAQLCRRVQRGLPHAGDFVFNCQMGRGRTTTGMITASLIATIFSPSQGEEPSEPAAPSFDSMDGPSEEEALLGGEYKTILQLVGILSHGRMAKRIADDAVDRMADVQNLRRAVYEYKLKLQATEQGTAKARRLQQVGVNYLYRYATLIVFANYLMEIQTKEISPERVFPEWLTEHREITALLRKTSLD